MELKFDEKCFLQFVKLIHELTGITIAKNRISMLEGRLRKRVVFLKMRGYDEYLALVRDDKEEQRPFIDLITTNETYFFRTPRIWDYLEKKFLPGWMNANPKKVFTAWSAAASSGEEASSLGILCQMFREKNPSFLYQILGTDISEEMVSLCRDGIYEGRSIDSFKKTRQPLFDRHMKSEDHIRYRLSTEIKSRLRFQQHNLFQRLQSLEKFDLILARNVLIYFNDFDQEKVLSLLAPRLAPNGLLVIGESESLTRIQTQFISVEPFVYSLNQVSKVSKAA